MLVRIPFSPYLHECMSLGPTAPNMLRLASQLEEEGRPLDLQMSSQTVYPANYVRYLESGDAWEIAPSTARLAKQLMAWQP